MRQQTVGCVKPRNNLLFASTLSNTLPNYYLSATFGGKSSAKATARTSVGSKEQKSLKRMLRNQSI